MVMPPASLVEWTKFIGLVVSILVAVKTLWSGSIYLSFKGKP
jgi:hypothetical protein